ncbi:MAG: hypothetical protein R2753_06685 [Chitinophagales bacterium]
MQEIERLASIPKSLNMSKEALSDGWFHSSNEHVNKLRTLGIKWNKQLCILSRKDENDWVLWSGVNLLSLEQTDMAESKLRRLRSKMKSLEKGCYGISQLIDITYLTDHLDFFLPNPFKPNTWKPIYMPSIYIIDEIVAKETKEYFNQCAAKTRKIIVSLDNAIDSTNDYKWWSFDIKY